MLTSLFSPLRTPLDPLDPLATERLVPPSWLPTWADRSWRLAEEQPALAALAIIVLSLIAAKIVEMFIRRGVARLTAKTRTHTDDRLVELLE